MHRMFSHRRNFLSFLEACNKKRSLRLQRGKQREGAAFHLNSASEALKKRFKKSPNGSWQVKWGRTENLNLFSPHSLGVLMLKHRHTCAHKTLLKTLSGESRFIPHHFYKRYSMSLYKKERLQTETRENPTCTVLVRNHILN